MKTTILIATACALALVSGCATRASGVAPIAISSAEYAHLNCAQGREQLAAARTRENALTRQQNNAATADAAGVFFLLIPVGSVFGSDVAGELAQAKGEVNALTRHVDARCSAEAQAAAQPIATPAPAPAPATAPVETLVPASPN
jgi:hypothetical protein